MGRTRFVRSVLGALTGIVLLLPAVASAAEVPCSAHTDTRLTSMSDAGIGLTSSLGLASGRYAMPASSAPTQLVVMFHGHGNDSCSWRRHLQQAAAKGAVAVAMDYTGQRQTPVENYGWFVREGAVDSINAAKHFLAAYPSIKQVFAFGVSMGGQAAALAVASPAALRSDGSPLFDYLIDVEGVNNIIEEYLIARGVAPVNDGAALAQQEIEEENGGSLEAVPNRYRRMNPVERANDMKNLKGAVLVNAVDDGLVPTNQSREMFIALVGAGVPSHLYTVFGRGGGEAGTTATGIVAGPVFAAVGSEYPAPLAGHGWEGSDTHLTIRTGFDQLYALMAGGAVATGETPVPSA
jgi:pimeloyl-ACP methyl ester carboxylesterase